MGEQDTRGKPAASSASRSSHGRWGVPNSWATSYACPARTVTRSPWSRNSDWWPSVWPGVGTIRTPGAISCSPSSSTYRTPGSSESMVCPPHEGEGQLGALDEDGGAGEEPVATDVVEVEVAVHDGVHVRGTDGEGLADGPVVGVGLRGTGPHPGVEEQAPSGVPHEIPEHGLHARVEPAPFGGGAGEVPEIEGVDGDHATSLPGGGRGKHDGATDPARTPATRASGRGGGGPGRYRPSLARRPTRSSVSTAAAPSVTVS